MTLSIRLWVAAILVAGVYGGVLVVGHLAMLPTEVRPPKRDLRELPTELGDEPKRWVAQKDSQGAQTIVDDDADHRRTYVYRNPEGVVVSLYVAIWEEGRSRTRHPPDICYPENGYPIVSKEDTELEIGPESTITVRFLLLERDGERFGLLYWYQRGNNVLLFSNWDRRATWLPRAEGVWPPLVKVMLLVPAPDANKAVDQLKSIAQPLYAWTKEL